MTTIQEAFTLESKKKDEPKDSKDAPEAKSDAVGDEEEIDEETGGKLPLVDAIRAETLNILADLVELSRGPKTAQAVPAK